MTTDPECSDLSSFGVPWVSDLPERLTERVCRNNGVPLRLPADYVLHWMTGGSRAHEQPALDLAIEIANRAGVGVLSVQGLSASIPFASDRHFAFALEAAPEIAVGCRERGVEYRFFLVRSRDERSPLGDLVRRAAAVVVDEVPVPPLVDQVRALERFGARPDVGVPVLSVDTSCIVPMPLGPGEPRRAFKFRDRTEKLRAARIGCEWPEPSAVDRPVLDDLPFEALALDGCAARPELIRRWIGECAIDHSVAPVADTPGGVGAGYERWDRFKRRIRHYAGTRNDPTKHGVSRMSGYLHHGQVSPFRLAREARAIGSKGAEKYLDELLIWRELAWHWAFREAAVHDPKAIPDWARRSLGAHRSDAREFLLDSEDATRGRSGDELWDLCQTSLVRHGELHNNLRMTWGKALVTWSASPERAVKRLVDLNHRFALDGRDPSSYGGLYWCVGLFDRPFEPEQPVLGTVRPRPVAEHRGRLRVDAYREHVSRPVGSSRPRIAVIGAGIAGSICARTLIDHGLDVTVFDKGRGPGGRMSTRRTEGSSGGRLVFDHGAQYFTARDPRFRRSVAHWIESGQVARWNGRFVTLREGEIGPDPNPGPRYVGTPSMSQVVRHLQRDVEPRFGIEVAAVERNGKGFELLDRNGQSVGESFGDFDFVLSTAPLPQTATLFRGPRPSFIERCEQADPAPSICAMFAFDAPLELGFDAAFVDDPILSWIARNGTKPGRDSSVECLVVHSTGDWARSVLEESAETWAPAMRAALERSIGRVLPEPAHSATHRWRYALAPDGGGDDSAFDEDLGLGVAGDGCTGGRVEGAFLSGQDLAGRVLRFVTAD